MDAARTQLVDGQGRIINFAVESNDAVSGGTPFINPKRPCFVFWDTPYALNFQGNLADGSPAVYTDPITKAKIGYRLDHQEYLVSVDALTGTISIVYGPLTRVQLDGNGRFSGTFTLNSVALNSGSGAPSFGCVPDPHNPGSSICVTDPTKILVGYFTQVIPPFPGEISHPINRYFAISAPASTNLKSMTCILTSANLSDAMNTYCSAFDELQPLCAAYHSTILPALCTSAPTVCAFG